MSNNRIATFFLMVGDIKLARSSAFNKEGHERVSSSELEETVHGHYKQSSYILTGQ